MVSRAFAPAYMKGPGFDPGISIFSSSIHHFFLSVRKYKHNARKHRLTRHICRIYIPRGMAVCFVCCVALHPKSTAMVIAGRSVHLTTLFPGQA